MSDGESSPASTRCSIKNNRVERSIFTRAFECLPQDVRDVVTREFDCSATDQRADMAWRSNPLCQELTEKGLQFVDVDRTPFREALGKTTFDLLQGVKGTFGDEAWVHLEKTSGKRV
jgi:TRAP-type C4-dicarboxylate transport system substrate-binding protein